MTKKRKHRLVVEITTNVHLTEHDAILALQIILDEADTQSRPIWAYSNVYADNLIAKSFTRVITALKLSWIKKAQRDYAGESVYLTLNAMRSAIAP